MTYGGGEWMGWQWLLDEEAAVQHIKYACVRISLSFGIGIGVLDRVR